MYVSQTPSLAHVQVNAGLHAAHVAAVHVDLQHSHVSHDAAHGGGCAGTAGPPVNQGWATEDRLSSYWLVQQPWI